MVEEWERQKNETGKAWEAFIVYRSLNPSERSERAVCTRLAKAPSQIHVWSSKYNWVERAVAWDNYLDKKIQDRIARERDKMIERHTDLGKAFQGVSAHKLKKYKERIERGEELDITPKDVRDFGELGVKIERNARDLPDIIQGSDVNIRIVEV